MLAKLCLLLALLLRTSLSIPNPKTELDILIEEVFKDTNMDSNENINSSPNPIQVVDETTPKINVEPLGACKDGYKCVPYYLCKDNQIIKDENIINIRVDDEEDKNCSGYLDTCCAIGNQVSKPIYKTPETAQQKECGIRNPDGIVFQISNRKDNETEYGEFPWMVALLKEEQVSNEILNTYQCGGSLITSSVVLTAAHCVANKPVNSLKVRAGEWDTQTKSEMFMDQDRDLIDVIVHENFGISRLFNDIALLFVSTPFDLADNIQPICLPPHGMNFDNLRCYATGWGKDRSGKAGQYQQVLKKIDLPIVPNLQCETALRTTRLTKHFQLHESFLCAGGEIGKDTCKGDGGSPLVCPIPNTINRYYQVGIVSWGIGCGDTIPGVYASISHFRSWIDSVLARKNLSDTQFNYEN